MPPAPTTTTTTVPPAPTTTTTTVPAVVLPDHFPHDQHHGPGRADRHRHPDDDGAGARIPQRHAEAGRPPAAGAGPGIQLHGPHQLPVPRKSEHPALLLGLHAGSVAYTPLGPPFANTYNALGYDTLNNYMYAITLGDNTLLQIDANGGVTTGTGQRTSGAGVFDTRVRRPEPSTSRATTG